MSTRIGCENVTAGYRGDAVLIDITMSAAAGAVTALIGPNGCGKSTLLRVLGRQLAPRSGRVLIDGAPPPSGGARAFARHVAFLPQHPEAPEGITVRELIGYGRYPHTGPFASPGRRDAAAIDGAAARAGVDHLLHRPVSGLSGGQRQRAWIAMTLAQETPIVLLDEPTTYLDPAHQLSVLELITSLGREGRTVVMVVHDMVHAARFAEEIVAMRDGRIHARGETGATLRPDLIAEVFGVECIVARDPRTGRELPIPYGRRPGSSVASCHASRRHPDL